MPRRYRVDITRAAERDIESIYAFIVRDDAAGAGRWVDEIERQIAALERSPARCSVIPEAADLGREYRHLLHGSYRTIVRIAGDRVIVLRVIHSARLLDLSVLDQP